MTRPDPERRPIGTQSPDAFHGEDHATEDPDSGVFIGHEPEWTKDTVPGGIGPKDERIAGTATQAGPRVAEGEMPEGHAEGSTAGDDAVREAGQDR